MKFSKVIYLLLIGAVLALFAFLIDFTKPVEMKEKEVIVPLVKDKVDAKPIKIKENTVKNAETIKLEVVRVRPDGSLVIAGKTLPNSKIECTLQPLAVLQAQQQIPQSYRLKS